MESQDIESQLANILSESASAPFLFIGSGFSRRYIGLPDWVGLLKKFSKKPFASYLGKANGDIPEAALALASDYYDEWWEKNEDNSEVYESTKWVDKEDSPLKYEVSKYLSNYDINEEVLNNPELIELRSDKVVIDGIITTNWDLLLEKIFPKLKVYVGQSDILFRYPRSNGAIFKIHGCCSRYDSLILSSNDYKDFNNKNPYLASKLLAIFLEKPVIFIGYSVSDKNITDILEKIESVLDTQDKVDRLSRNMIFVSRAHGKKDKISSVIKNINEKNLTFTSIETDDFGKIYKALQHSKRKIPVEVLRMFEEQIYEIVNSRKLADSRLKVISFEDLLEGDDIEFVAGIGVASSAEYGRIGLSGVKPIHLIRDVIFDDLKFESDQIIEVLPELIKFSSTYIPIRKYILNKNLSSDVCNDENMKARMDLTVDSYIGKIYNHKALSQELKEISNPNEIIDLNYSSINRTLNALAVWLNDNRTIKNCNLVKGIVKEKYEDWIKPKDKTNVKRLVCIVDEIENNELKRM
ncbi:SIR2 family protein [Psychrobacter arenosus]|uniref:SIR2 family protein n=1 Tax=Psychrobacter arenosus TaxID=256326 RepID=UPI0019190F83|nr:SIR2 family protein [Psychrobacter arenosus]